MTAPMTPMTMVPTAISRDCCRRHLCFFPTLHAIDDSLTHTHTSICFPFIHSFSQWKITHLDGREIVIKTRPGEVIKAETKDASGKTLPYIKMVKDEGMPSRGNPFVKGNLYIAFYIKFPDSLPPEAVEALKKVLPGVDEPEMYDVDTVEECFMDDADLRHFGKGGAATSENEYDSDEEGGAQGVQCQQS